MSQSSGDLGRSGGDERERWILLYAGLAGAALLSIGLWILRGWIARAATLELTAGIMALLGGGVVLSVITALSLFATRVDRVSEDVSKALDDIAAGTLTTELIATRGLGREARLAGAAAAAFARLRAWLDASRSATRSVEQGIINARAPLPRLREAVVSTSTQVGQVARDTRNLAAGAEEHGALTQRACVLAAVIGQSHRDTTAFADRVHAAVSDAATSLAECTARTAALRGLVGAQAESATSCLEADRQLTEYLTVVNKSARQFKLLALHAAMEAARAGARAREDATRMADEGRGAEFRVVALEVRNLAVSLLQATEAITRTVDGARRSLQALHAAASDGERQVHAAENALSLGSTSLDQAVNAVSTRRGDDAALAEAGTELTILTSAIRERALSSAKGAHDVADRLVMLDQALAACETTAREVEQALASAQETAERTRENVSGIALVTVGSAVPPRVAGAPPPQPRRNKRPRSIPRVPSSTGASA